MRVLQRPPKSPVEPSIIGIGPDIRLDDWKGNYQYSTEYLRMISGHLDDFAKCKVDMLHLWRFCFSWISVEIWKLKEELLSMAVGQELVQLFGPVWVQTLRGAAPGLSGNKTNDNSHQVAESLPAPKTRLCLQHSGYHNHSSVCCQIFSSDFAWFLKSLWMSCPMMCLR